MEKVPRAELQTLVQRVLGKLPTKKGTATILALVGELGAGKTTFVQTLAKEMGVEETVQSPTYVLMKSYPVTYNQFTTLIHIDAYRLEKPEEFETLKPQTFLQDPKTLVCIEWPERVKGALPEPDLILNFSSDGAGEEERYISYNNDPE